MGKFYSLPQFPICLTIKLISPDKYSRIVLAGIQDNAICGYSLIWFNLDYTSDFNILTENLSSAWLLNECVSLIISFLVPFFSIQIIIGLFDQSKP